MSEHFIERTDLPDGFGYPAQYTRIVEQGLVNLTPWQILDGVAATKRLHGLRSRFPGSVLVPFTRRQDNDDIAVWDLSGPSRVVVLHDFAGPGFENRRVFDTFWDWFRQAIEEMIAFEP